MDTLWNTELRRQERLETIRAGIIYALKHNTLDFNEFDLRQKLNNISNEEKLFKLQSLAPKTDDINSFYDHLKQINTLLDPEILQQKQLETSRENIIFTLKHQGFIFNEVDLRQRLNAILDCERLFILNMVAAQIDDIETFIKRL